MPIIGPINSLVFEVELKCPECGIESFAPAVAPLDGRSLRSFVQAAAALAGPLAEEGPACPCGNLSQVVRVRYRFDEPDMEELVYDIEEDALQVGGVTVESEEDLAELVGRPFSVADLHRIKLSAGFPGSYLASPGLAVIAVDGKSVEELVQEAAGAPEQDNPAKDSMDQAAELLRGSDISQGLLGPFSWSRCGGWRSWLGEPGERIDEGELLCASIIVAAEMFGEIERKAEQFEMEFVLDVDKGQASIKAFEQRIDLDLDHVALLTVENALTISEAAAWAVVSAHRTLSCCGEVAARLRQDGVVLTPDEDGYLIAFPDQEEMTGSMNLVSIVRKSQHDADEAIESIERLLDQMKAGEGPASSELGVAKACGCTPNLTYVVRSESWFENRREEYGKDYPMLARPAWPGAVKVAVEDCLHSLSYITAPKAEQGEEQLLDKAQKGLSVSHFSVYSRPFKSAEGKVHAVLWAGHNVSTVLLDKDLVRGLDRQSPSVDKSIDQLAAASLTSDLVLLFDEDADQRLLEIQMSALMREISEDSPWEVSARQPHLVEVERKGQRSGKFNVFKL